MPAASRSLIKNSAFCLTGVLIAGSLVGLTGTSASAATFSTPGTDTYVVPSGVTSVTFLVKGGNGGDGGNGGLVEGGAGAEITGTLTVTPGETLYLTVGADGGAGTTNAGNNGGGGGGGSYSAIARGSAVGTPVVVAGAGGGAGGRVGGVGGDAGAAGGTGAAGSGTTGGAGGEPGVGATGGAGGAAATPPGAAGGAGGNSGSNGSAGTPPGGNGGGGGGGGFGGSGGAAGSASGGVGGGAGGTPGNGGTNVNSAGGGGGSGYAGGGGGGSSDGNSGSGGGGGAGGSSLVPSGAALTTNDDAPSITLLNSQTIDFADPSDVGISDSPVALTATATSGLTVTFASETPAVCTVAGASATLVAAGTCTVSANQPGDADWEAAPEVQQSFTVTKQSQVATCAVGARPQMKIPRRGLRVLNTADCETNAGKTVGVRMQARLSRGDLRLAKLWCNVGGKLRTPQYTGRADRSQHCRQGPLLIQTFGTRLNLTIRWSAPADATFAPYRVVRKFRT